MIWICAEIWKSAVAINSFVAYRKKVDRQPPTVQSKKMSKDEQKTDIQQLSEIFEALPLKKKVEGFAEIMGIYSDSLRTLDDPELERLRDILDTITSQIDSRVDAIATVYGLVSD